MNPIRFDKPGGIVPRLSPRQLPDGAAQVAANVSVLSGEWEPMRKPKHAWAPAVTVDPLLSIHKLDADTWLGWTIAGVRVVESPLPGEARYIITGDGCPRLTTKALASPVSAVGKPASSLALGVPTPQVAPSVAASGGTGAAVSRFYVYTFYSDRNEESSESAPSALVTGKVDDTWALTGMDSAPPNSGTITGASKTATQVTFSLAARHYCRVGDEFTVGSILGMTDANGVWEVAAVPATNQITIDLVTAQTYTSGGTWARTVPWGTCTKRIYRTSGTLGDFQLVAEGVTGTTYNDTILDANMLGDSLVSTGWVPPDAKMTGVVAMPGGILAGFIEDTKVLCFSEPYQPHAWPVAYQRTQTDKIIGIAAFDTNLAVATAGVPVVYSGIDPAGMSPTRHEKPFPCTSRASVVSVADAALFSTSTGLVRVDLSGVQMMTDPLFTPQQWHDLQPANISCAYDGTRLYIGTPVQDRLFVLDLGQGGAMVTAYQRQGCTWADPSTGSLYFCVGAKVYEFDSLDTAPATFDWMSAEFVLQKPAAIGAAKVEFDQAYYADMAALIAAEIAEVVAANQILMAGTWGGRGGLGLAAMNEIEMNGSILAPIPDASPSIALTIYANGVVVFSGVIPNEKAFKLPAGYRAHTLAYRWQANTKVRCLVLGETMKSLAGA